MRNVLRLLVAPAALLALLGTPLLAQVETTCPTSPNSVGAGAVLRWEGPTNLGAGRMVVAGLPLNAMGVFVYGRAGDATPFGDGLACIGGPRWVLARKRARLGAVSLDVAAEGELEDVRWIQQNVGQPIHFQYLYRDPRGHGARFNLSNGIRVFLGMGL